MFTQNLIKLFTRDLLKLKQEIESYKNEEAIWKTEVNIANSAGNLCLHLVGNLNTYIGKELGRTGYVRDRDLEFSQKNVPRQELIAKINDTIHIVNESLNKLDEANLKADFPVIVLDGITSTGYFLMHLAMHLSYHLGQVNYHRRLIDRMSAG